MNKNLKAGMWYTASNIINKGIAYISTPIFTRIMTKQEFGDFSNFVSWGTLLLIITSLDLYSSINRAYFDFKEDMDEYMSSVSAVSIFFTTICYCIVFIFKDAFINIFNMDFKYVNMLFLYLLFYPAFNFFMTEQRISGHYKLFSVVSIGTSLFSMLCSVVLVLNFENRLWGRVLGYVIPTVMSAIAIYGAFFFRGKKIVRGKMKYALLISVPLIPHHLSGNVLSSSDRIMIKRYCGSEATAYYSLAYNCSMIVTLLHTSINQAYIPWLYEKMNKDDLRGIKKISEEILLAFFVLVFGLLLIAPEIIYILGGKAYMEAINVLPPVILGCCFQFLYTMYVNIEFYCKKTFSISIGTCIAAALNVILNFWLIPQYGYIAAAYTTLVGYIVLYVIHYLATRKMDFADIYDNRKILSYSVLMSGFCFLIYLIYRVKYVRYFLVATYIGIMIKLFLVMKKKYIKK